MGYKKHRYAGIKHTEDLILTFFTELGITNGKNLIARVSSRSQARAGDNITVALDTSRIHIFDKDTEKCICH